MWNEREDLGDGGTSDLLLFLIDDPYYREFLIAKLKSQFQNRWICRLSTEGKKNTSLFLLTLTSI